MWKGINLGAVASAPVQDLREHLGLGDAKKDAQAKAEEEDDEAQTHDLTCDDQSVRYKNWRDTCAASRVHVFSDVPLAGPITTLDLAKHMQKFGGAPSNWMMKFAREKHIVATDRTWHELKVLTGVLQAAGTYDQLHVGSLASLEIVSRRIQAIADAHAVPGRVDWSNGRFIAGQDEVGDAVAMSLRQ